MKFKLAGNRLILSSLLILILTFIVFSCKPKAIESGSESISENDSTSNKQALPDPIDFDLDKILERDTLKVIVDNSSTSYFLYKGRPMGFEYELLERLAADLGVSLQLIITVNLAATFAKLNRGEADIIAYPLTITRERKKFVNFTHDHYTVREVLVQRKPENWRDMKLHEIEKSLIRNQVDLIGKEVYVRKSSSYLQRLKHLSEEMGGEILILEENESEDTESIIKKVADGIIPLTISDENVAMVNASYYPNIDVKTPVSFPQRIGWALRMNATKTLEKVNEWIDREKRLPDYNVLYNKYFLSPRTSLSIATSDFSSIKGSRISEYDDLIKIAAASIGWDWKLLTAMVYQESKFDKNAKSWAGAVGLMQMVSATAKSFGVKERTNPEQSITGGAKYIKYLQGLWEDKITDDAERIKFIMASYNVGPGHVFDARALARKYGRDDTLWENNVAHYLLLKSKPKYFKDPVVKSGYCRGSEPVKYVKEILTRYQQYAQLITSS